MTFSHRIAFLATSLLVVAPLSAQSVSVNATSPNAAAQGTINLNVSISGKGFKNGANSRFLVTGSTDSGGVVVHGTSFVNSTQLVANIDVSAGAVVSGFDVAVDNPDGHSGKGSDVFNVIQGGAAPNGACVIPQLPAGYSLAATLNPQAGPPLYTNLIGKATKGNLTTVLGQSAILVATGGGSDGGGSGFADVFFLDPSTGAVKDGTWGQPHLTLSLPVTSFYTVNIADVNGDGVPDLLFGARNYGTAWVHLGSGGGAGTLSFGPAILLRPVGSLASIAIATGDLDHNGSTEIALGVVASTKNSVGQVLLYRWNGAGFTNYRTINDPENGADFGTAVAIGDVTGDNLTDLVVGASNSSSGRNTAAGRVWVYPSVTGTPFSLSTGVKNDGFGSAVAVGNLTGASGGFSDLLSTLGLSSTNPRSLVYGGPVTTSSQPVLSLAGKLDWPTSGLDLADIDGDGLADVIIGAESTGCSGQALVYLSGAGFQQTVISGPVAPSGGQAVGYGSSVSWVPGTHIFLVGDKYATIGGVSNAGQVYVYKKN